MVTGNRLLLKMKVFYALNSMIRLPGLGSGQFGVSSSASVSCLSILVLNQTFIQNDTLLSQVNLSSNYVDYLFNENMDGFQIALKMMNNSDMDIVTGWHNMSSLKDDNVRDEVFLALSMVSCGSGSPGG